VESIEAIKKRVYPKAVLKPITSEAERAVHRTCLPNHMIGVWEFPFNLGRESRIVTIKGEEVIMERKKGDGHKPNNDFYILDFGKRLQISREHLGIDFVDGEFFVTDRKSSCGTIINAESIGGSDEGGKHVLKQGDLIKLGTDESHYIFEFIVLN